MINRLCIIGVGLIGSSLSLALKQAGAVGEVVGYGRNRANLEKGIELGVLDRYETSIAAAVKDADMVVIAVPLGAMQAVLAELAGSVDKNAVITDGGSAKAAVVRAAQAELGALMPRFVPGHPIAGTEKSGVEAGFLQIFDHEVAVHLAVDGSFQHATRNVTDTTENLSGFRIVRPLGNT